jgi:hypothetical protein
LGIHRTELCIDPADEIAVGDIAHEQEQAVGHLVQVAVAQRLARQWAGGDVVRHGQARWARIRASLARSPSCPKLGGYWRSERGGPMTALSIVVWFKRAYAYLGLEC